MHLFLLQIFFITSKTHLKRDFFKTLFPIPSKSIFLLNKCKDLSEPEAKFYQIA